MDKEKYIFTIGCNEKSLKEFVNLLSENNITKVIDIRLKTSSQLSGFAKGEDLKYILEEFLKLKYEHQLLLCPTEEILEKYKKDKNWDAYELVFNDLISQRHIEILLPSILKSNEKICLLCSENYAGKCHRRLVAEYFKKIDNNIKIIHLEKQIPSPKSHKKDSTKGKQRQISSVNEYTKIYG